MKDLVSDLLPVTNIDPIVANNTAEGTGGAIDLQGFEGALMIAHLGASLDTLSGSVYVTVSFQESDTTTAGDFANIAAGNLKGGANDVVVDAAAEDEIVITRGYLGTKRYVRILITFTGTHTNGFPLNAIIVKGKPRHAPVV